MEIVEIHKPYLYSIKFEEEELDEFNRLLEEWSDVESVKDFIDSNKEVYNSYLARFFTDTFEAADQVAEEAYAMELYFEELKENLDSGQYPGFDDYFKFLEGKYECEMRYIPMKGYGEGFRPSLIRFYAIKIKPNVYVIATGGIKLGRSIQDSPRLKDYIIKKIDNVRNYLSSLGITEAGDMD